MLNRSSGGGRELAFQKEENHLGNKGGAPKKLSKETLTGRGIRDDEGGRAVNSPRERPGLKNKGRLWDLLCNRRKDVVTGKGGRAGSRRYCLKRTEKKGLPSRLIPWSSIRGVRLFRREARRRKKKEVDSWYPPENKGPSTTT